MSKISNRTRIKIARRYIPKINEACTPYYTSPFANWMAEEFDLFCTYKTTAHIWFKPNDNKKYLLFLLKYKDVMK